MLRIPLSGLQKLRKQPERYVTLGQEIINIKLNILFMEYSYKYYPGKFSRYFTIHFLKI
jgi:hypothetical protein